MRAYTCSKAEISSQYFASGFTWTQSSSASRNGGSCDAITVRSADWSIQNPCLKFFLDCFVEKSPHSIVARVSRRWGRSRYVRRKHNNSCTFCASNPLTRMFSLWMENFPKRRIFSVFILAIPNDLFCLLSMNRFTADQSIVKLICVTCDRQRLGFLHRHGICLLHWCISFVFVRIKLNCLLFFRP